MFSGIQEILLLLIILLAILFLPRVIAQFRATDAKKPRPVRKPLHISGRLRLALTASLLWPLGVAVYFKPWRAGTLEPFLYFGVGPVFLAWGIVWIISGFARQKQKF
jgi:hypothetical protein